MSPSKRKSAPPQSRSSRRPRGITFAVLILLLAGGAILLLWWPRAEPNGADVSGSHHPVNTAGGSDSPIVPRQEEVFARYAGSQDCRECHAQAHDRWKTSNHYFAERTLQSHLDHAAFDPPGSLLHGTQRTETMASNGVRQIVAHSSNGVSKTYFPRRVIGHDPLRQFLVEGPRGRLQAFSTAWDPHRSELFHLFGNEDRQPGEWGHWTGRGMAWNSMCAACHNTRLRKNYDEATDSYRTAHAEMTVGCEACHGPMKSHATWHRHHPDSPENEPTEYKLSKEQMLDTCGSCHSRRYELTGDFQPGDSYFDHYALTIVDETDVYYADGQVREEDYVFASFLSSRMHAAGVTCLDCHEPHTSRPILPGNTLCMRCHSGGYPNSPVIDPASHSFHKPDSTGSQCVNCHMPHTTYMQRHPRRDHGFSIPDPLLTKELGIPNACNRCHEDQDADWALRAVDEWYGPKMERYSRQRARWVAAARRGDALGRDGLLGLLQGEEIFYWKAVAANLLERWVDEPEIRDELMQAAEHDHPLVRANAVHSLGPLVEAGAFPDVARAVRGRLDDASRSVRYQAAWALRGSLDMSSLAGRELGWALDFNADQPTGQMQKGVLALARNQPEAALPHYLRAVEWDPNSPPLRHELAVVYSMLGEPEKALAQMREACRLAPDEAEYQYKLGLALNEMGELAEAAAAMEMAVALDPGHGRAWYNLGLARHQLGRVESALEALIRGENARPDDPGIPYARATILAQIGRYAEARQAAQRALEIDPAHEAARGLLSALP